MANILDSLYPGSWNGVSFLIEESSISGGRKHVIHEFPNSDQRYVEDLGLLNETINLSVCVPTDDYFSKRDSIKDALESSGYGTLIHPFYGIRNAVCTSYTINETTTELGYAKISMVLSVGQELTFSGIGNLTSGSVFEFSESLFSALSSMISSTFMYNADYGRISSSIGAVLTGLSTRFNLASSSFTGGPEFLEENTAEYIATSTKYSTDSYSFLRNPDLFAERTLDLAQKLDNITPDGRSGYTVAKVLSDYELPTPLKQPVNAAGVYQNRMKEIIRIYIKSLAFGLCCQNAALYPYSTVDEYNEVRADLESRYSALSVLYANLSQYNFDGSGSSDISKAEDAVNNLRSSTINFIDQTATTLPALISVEGKNLPLTVFTYMHYGDLSRVDFLQELNFPEIIDPSDLDSLVEILSGVT